MESTFVKTVKGSTMEQIFDSCELFSVKYFKALNLKNENDWDADKKYKYEIIIRHADGTDAKSLFLLEVDRIEN